LYDLNICVGPVQGGNYSGLRDNPALTSFVIHGIALCGIRWGQYTRREGFLQRRSRQKSLTSHLLVRL
jgi:hypothetical protein